MTIAQNLGLLAANTTSTGLVTPSTISNQANTSTGFLSIPVGTTQQRPQSVQVGYIRFNTTINALEQYSGTNWQSIESSAIITSVTLPGTQTAVFTGDSVTVNGTGFTSSGVLRVVLNGVEYTPTTTSFISSSQMTMTMPSGLPEGTYNVKYTGPSGAVSMFNTAFSVDGIPAFRTAAGSLGSVLDTYGSSVNYDCGADEDVGQTITYSISSGSLPSGLTLNTSTGFITGLPNTGTTVDTTYNFTVRAVDQENQQSTRSFSITVLSVLGSPVQTDLFIHYDLSSNTTYSGSGSTLTDLIGTQNGTITNATFAGTGVAKYLQFTNSGDVVQLGNSIPAAQSTTQVTIEAWHYINVVGTGATDGIGAIISSQNDGAGQQGVSINTDSRGAHGGGPNGYHFQAGKGGGFTTDGSNGNTGQNSGNVSNHWDHVAAVVYSDGRKVVFENGKPLRSMGTWAGSLRYSGTHWRLGNQPDVTGRRYQGRIGVARIYNRGLTASEIEQNYRAQKHRFTPNTQTVNTLNVLGDGSCIALWQFNNNANDVSGNYSATSVGAGASYSSTQKLFGSHSLLLTRASNSFVDIPNVKNSYPFSFSAWVKSTNGFYAGTGSQVFQQLLNTSINGQRVSMGFIENVSGWSKPTGMAMMFGGTSHFAADSPYTLGVADFDTWHHFVWVVNANLSFQLYMNGNPLVATDNGGGHGGTASWRIGNNADGNESIGCYLDQARFFNKALSESEVWTLFNERE